MAGGQAAGGGGEAITAVAGGVAAAGGKAEEGKTTVTPEEMQAEIRKAIEADRVTRAGSDQRERFIRERMMNLPNSVRDLLPKTGNVAELEKARRQLVAELNDWFAAGVKAKGIQWPPNVGGAAGDGGVAPGATPPPPARGSGLTGGQAAFAARMKLPGR